MKKVILFFGICMLSATLTFAQRGGTPEERAQRQTEMLTKQLELTADQTTKIQTINLERAKKMEELRASGDRPDRDKMQAMQTEFEGKLKPILSADQWKKYEQYREEQRNRMRNGGGGPGGRR